MAILIGVDEAGYGPNLGPLCIGASAWRVKAAGIRQQAAVDRGQSAVGSRQASVDSKLADERVSSGVDLYELFDGYVSRKVTAGRVAIADSKQLYKPASGSGPNAGLTHLERGVLGAMSALTPDARGCGTRPANTCEYIAATSADPGERRGGIAWYEGDATALPLDAADETIDQAADCLREGMQQAGVELQAMRGRLVYPEEFNTLVETYGTKGAALSHVTLALVRDVINAIVTEIAPSEIPARRGRLPTAFTIICDKHGGRNRYGALLQHHFPEPWITTEIESRAESRYSWEAEAGKFSICFRTRGEAFLPTALASMVAKYHRELAMRALNAFWQQQVPGIKPTAGYPQDAKRFRKEIAAKQQELGIVDRVLWRER